MSNLAAEVNRLRAMRQHLDAQVTAGNNTSKATHAQASEALRVVERDLADAENAARREPELGYLFRRRPRKGGGSTKSTTSSEQRVKSDNTEQGDTTMARQSKAAQLEAVLIDLKKAEKSAGSTKWALEGAGAAKNPPSPERKIALTEKLAKEQATIAELRAKRDELKGTAVAV